MTKMPDYKVAQYVHGQPRFKLSERREVLRGAMSTSYMRQDVKDAIRKARDGGMTASHEDEDVRHFLLNYGSENQLSPEGLKKFLVGGEKFLAGHHAFRHRYAVRPGHVEEDARVKGKLLAREAVTEKKQEMLDEAREGLVRRQRRADLRDPEKRAALLRPGIAPAMGSSIVQKETPDAGLASVFDYKPGSAPGENPNPTGPQNPVGPQNPAGGASATPMPLGGFHGLTHAPGHELPGEAGGLSHAPADPYTSSEEPLSEPSASISSVPPIGHSEPDSPASPSPSPVEPEDMEIG